MAKYNWKELEKEYILGDYKSVSAFLKDKGIARNKTTNNETKGWKEKKQQKNIQKTSKTIEKVIEKEADKEAKKILNVKDTAEELLNKVNESISELNKYLKKNTKKTKVIEYDYTVGKPSKETIEENEEIQEFFSIIDRSGLKQLTSALKDINDILNNNENSSTDGSYLDELEQAWRKRNEK